MEKIKLKKGILFSVIALMIITFFSISFQIGRELTFLKRDLSSSRGQVELLNMAVNDLEDKYFQILVESTGRAALEGMSEYSVRNEIYITDIKNNFILAFKTGKIVLEDNEIDISSSYMDLSRPANVIIEEMIAQYDNIGLMIREFDVRILDFEQIDPWLVRVSVKFRYYIEDTKGITAWGGESIKDTNIHISGMWIPVGVSPKVPTKIIPSGFVHCTDNPGFLRKLQENTINFDPEEAKLGLCKI